LRFEVYRDRCRGRRTIVWRERGRLSFFGCRVGLILPRTSCVVESEGAGGGPGCGRLRWLRSDIYGCFTRRADALFELCDAMACAPGSVAAPVELSLEPEFRRGHAMVHESLAHGLVDAGGCPAP
jgi:hypothetical protein